MYTEDYLIFHLMLLKQYIKKKHQVNNRHQLNLLEKDPIQKPNRGWLGTAWHYTGGALFTGVQELSDLATRAYRTGAIAVAEGKPLLGSGGAWDIANDNGDKVFNTGRIEDAIQKFTKKPNGYCNQNCLRRGTRKNY